MHYFRLYWFCLNVRVSPKELDSEPGDEAGMRLGDMSVWWGHTSLFLRGVLHIAVLTSNVSWIKPGMLVGRLCIPPMLAHCIVKLNGLFASGVKPSPCVAAFLN
jgi:hypothetical protein